MFKILTWNRDLFWEWCMENHIACEYMGTEKIGMGFDRKAYDTWYVGNEKDRMWAMLRWSS